jgi:hypothetical protein
VGFELPERDEEEVLRIHFHNVAVKPPDDVVSHA